MVGKGIPKETAQSLYAAAHPICKRQRIVLHAPTRALQLLLPRALGLNTVCATETGRACLPLELAQALVGSRLLTEVHAHLHAQPACTRHATFH
jgi:hypothetical protein